MGSAMSKARVIIYSIKSGVRYQCQVCTADYETADALDKDPTRTMSDIGKVAQPRKYF